MRIWATRTCTFARDRQSLPELRNEPAAASLSGNEFARGAKKLTEQVGDFFRSLGNSVFRKGLGSVIIDERGVKSDIAHGIGRAKAVTFAAVPAVIENGRQIDYQKNWKDRGYDTYVYAAPVKIGDAASYVAVVVRSGADNRFYLHEVVDGEGNLIYKMDASPAIKTGVTAKSGITGTGKAPTGGRAAGQEPTLPAQQTSGGTSETLLDNSGSPTATVPQPAASVKTQNAGRVTLPTAESGERRIVLPTAEEAEQLRESTAVNDNPARHTAQEQRVIEEYKSAVDPGLMEFYEAAKTDQKAGAFKLRNVTQRAAADISRLTGQKVDGFGTTLDARQAWHINNDHGESGKADHSMADSADVARIQYVLDNYDSAVNGGATDAYWETKANGKNRRAPVVVFSKKVNGTYYVVEAAPVTKAKSVYVVSAYMLEPGKTPPGKSGKNVTEVTSQLPDASAPWFTADTDSANVTSATATIPQPAASVKGQSRTERTLADRSGRIVLPTAEELDTGVRTWENEAITNEGGSYNGEEKQRTEAAGSGRRRETAEGVGQEILPDGNGGRLRSESAGGQAGILAEGRPRSAADTGRRALERKNTGRNLRLEKVSSRELGLENGTEARNLQLLPEDAWDEELRQIAQRVRRETGGGVTFVLGGIEITKGDGTAGSVRGVYSSGWIVVQADNMNVSAAQIADHELFHYYADSNPGLIQAVERAIVERYGREEFDETVQTYVRKLRGVVDLPEGATQEETEDALLDIKNEVLADAYAGINAFGAHAERYRDVTQETMRERSVIRGSETAAATDRRTGPPERYSEKQYSIEETEDGKKYVRADRQVIYGNDPESWSEQLEDYINGKIRRGQDVTLIGADGNELRLTAATAGKVSSIYKDGKRLGTDYLSRKFSAGAHIDELAEASRGFRSANDEGDVHAADASEGWNYRRAYFKDHDNAYYECIISVEKGADGNVVYNIGQMKKRPFPTAPKKALTGSSAESGARRGKRSFADSLSQSGLPVKRKFSLDEPVERTKDLIAVHNKDWAVIRDAALNWGGIPSPSVAIVDAKEGHVKYGDTSVVYPRATIDPQADSRNRVYGSDAWTPTSSSARVEREVSYDAKRRIESILERLSRQTANGIFSNGSVLGSAGIEDVTDLDAKEIARKLAAQDAVKAAYLASRGENIDVVHKAKEYDRIYGNAALKKYIDRVGPQKLAELYVKLETGKRLTRGELKQAEDVIRQAFEEKHARILARRPELREKRIADYMENNAAPNRVEDFIRHAQEYYAEGGAVTDEIDRMATRDRLNDAADTAEVEAWAERQLDGLLGEPGIYNGEDYYEPNGNRRSFGDTHWAYSAENIVRAMNNANARAEGMWGVTGTTLAATATPEYGSVEEMHADEGRLRKLEQGEYDRLIEDLGVELDCVTDDLMRTTKHHADNTYEEQEILGGIIAQAAQGERTVPAVKRAFRMEGYTISDGHAASIIRLLDHAASVPTEYFEAKPQRVVPFDEAVAIVAPDSAPAEEVAAVKAATGANIIQYETGNDAQRRELVNSLPGVRFSIDETEDNEPFVEVERDILAGVPEEDWASAVKENLKKKFPSGITVGNNEISIDKQSRREMTFSRYMQWLYNTDPQLRADKLRATDNADEILHAATGWVNEGLKHPRRDDIADFARGEVLLRVGENDYAADVVVGTRNDGSMILYDVLNLQPTSFTKKRTDAAITANPSPGAGRNTASVSDERVSQSGLSVKRKFSSDEPDAGGQEAAAVNGEQKPEEKKKKPRKVTKPVAESRPIIAKQELRRGLLNLFSIPTGMKAELGQYIDRMADRLLKEGGLSQKDRDEFFDYLYRSGVMTVEADEYRREARRAVVARHIYVPESVKHKFGDDWNSFRKRAFGAGVLLTNDRNDVGADVVNMELSETLPYFFDPQETDVGIMLERIVQAAEEGKAEDMSLEEYVELAAGREHVSEDEVLDSIERQMDWELRSFAEKAKLEIKLRDRTGIKIAQEREKAAEQSQQQRNREIIRRANEQARRTEVIKRQRENRELRELQQKTLKQLQWLAKNRQRAPEELRGAWDDILSDMDIYAVHAANEMRWSGRYNATWRDLADMYKTAQENDPNFLPSKELEKIVARLDNRKVADMDINALQDLYKAAVGLRTELYNRRNVINDDMHRLFADVYADSKQELEFGGETRGAAAQRSGKISERLLNLEQLSPMNVMQRMAGWNPDSTFYSMAKQLEQGERDIRAYTVKAEKQLEEFLNEHADWVKKADGQGKDAIWYEIEVPELLELRMGDKPIFGKTFKVWMTPSQKVHMYLESKNYDNLRHMEGGRTFADRELYSKGKRREAFAQGRTIRLAPETVKALVKDLTPEEQELAKALESYYNTFAAKEINRVSNILYGYDKAVTKNYAPIYTNNNYTKSELGVYEATAESVGNLKPRQYSKNPSYNIGAFDAFERHVEQTARFVGMAIPARNWQTLLNWREKDNSMADIISHTWGGESLEYIRDIVQTLQGEKSEKKTTLEKMPEQVFSNYISAVFGANPSIVFKQLGSIPLAAAWLGIGNMPNPAQIRSIDRALIGKYTQELDWRTLGYATPETKQLKENPNWTQSNRTANFLLGGGAITAMDGWAASTLWPWAENKVRREHPELETGTQEEIDSGVSPFYKKVAEEFNEAVARSQSTSDEMHQGSLRKSKNAIVRTFTMFKSDSSQTYNALRQRAGEASYYRRVENEEKERESKKLLGTAALMAIGGYAFAELVEFLMNLWKHKGNAYRDDDGELTAASITEGMVSGLIGDLAGVVTGGEELADILGNIIAGDERWYAPSAPGMEQLTDLAELIIRESKGFVRTSREMTDVVKNGGSLTEYLSRHGGDIIGGIKELAQNAATYIPGIPVNNLEAYLLGTVQWISPELAAAYEDALETADRSGLKGLTGGALEMRVGDILRNRHLDAGSETAKVLAELYEAGYTGAVPADTVGSVTVNGEQRTLSAYQQQVYDRVWSGTIGTALRELTESDGFRGAGQETQEAMLKGLYDYAKEQAKAVLFGGYEMDGFAQKAEDTIAAGADTAAWAEWYGLSRGLSTAEKYALLKEQSYSDAVKQAIAGGIMGTELKTESGKPSQYAKLLQVLDTGLDMDDYLTLRQAEAVDTFLNTAEAGTDAETAMAAALSIAGLEPEEGKKNVTAAQKWRAIIDSAKDAEEERNALRAVMTEKQFAQLEIAMEYGVETESFVHLKEILPDFDANGNGSFSQAEIEAAIDSMGGTLPGNGVITADQQAVLWQVFTGSTDPLKNPFSKSMPRGCTKWRRPRQRSLKRYSVRQKKCSTGGTRATPAMSSTPHGYAGCSKCEIPLALSLALFAPKMLNTVQKAGRKTGKTDR